jgi:glycine cleavage system transcriptional repressor
MNIQGYCERTLESLEEALAGLAAKGISADVAPVEILIG